MFEPAHGILKDVLRHFPESQPGEKSIENDPSSWEERLNSKQKRVRKWLQRRPQGLPRGKKKREHIEWLRRMSALPDDPTLVTSREKAQLQEAPTG